MQPTVLPCVRGTWTLTNTGHSTGSTGTLQNGWPAAEAVGNNITLNNGNTYTVTVQYEATDATQATSDPNTFKTSGVDGPG